MTIDGRVTGLNKDVYQTLQAIKNKNSGALTEADAQAIRTAVNKDGQVDANEADLLSELTQSKIRAVSIQSADAPANSVMFGTTSGKTRAVLQETLVSTEKLNELAGLGADGIRELTKIYQRSPADAERVVGALSRKGLEAWDKSSIGNAYGPLSDMISGAYSGIGKLEGKDNTDARWMLHRAMKQIDNQKNDAVPDFLYNWIRPGGYL